MKVKGQFTVARLNKIFCCLRRISFIYACRLILIAVLQFRGQNELAIIKFWGGKEEKGATVKIISVFFVDTFSF